MRLVIGFVFFAFAASVHAQGARLDSLRFVNAGILEFTGKAKIITDNSISVGQRTENESRLVKATTVIPMNDNTVFGTTMSVLGSPNGAPVSVRVVWRYPSPGIVDPRTSVGKLTDEYSHQTAIGNDLTLYWTLGARDETHVPGVWTLEVWDGNRRLFTQQFTLVRSQ
jgi:hypothetical protein